MARLDWRYICVTVASICLTSYVVCDTSSDPNSKQLSDEIENDPLSVRVPVPVPARRTANEDDEESSAEFYGLPGTQHEFRFEIDPGVNQCIFQHLQSGAQFHFTFQVVRGADHNINVELRDPTGITVEYLQWTKDGNIDTVLNVTGVYSICFDNSMSMFSSKLVYFYMLSYVEEDWRSFATEMQDFHVEVENFTKILETVNHNTNKVKVHQAMTRHQAISDWYTITGNNSFVRNVSIVMCIVIVMTSVFQAYFVRRLFNLYGTNVRSTGTSKPRA